MRYFVLLGFITSLKDTLKIHGDHSYTQRIAETANFAVNSAVPLFATLSR